MIDTKHRYEELRSVFENALDMVVAMDTSGIITEWNRQAEATFGWKKDEALGRHMADTIIPHKFRDAHRNGLKNFLETGDGPILNRRLEIAGLRRDGSEFPIELTITPIKTENELVFYAFLRDLTELKKNESERLRLLQETNARRELLEILVKNIPVGIVLVSQPELILEMANPIAKSILPFELEIGKSLFKHAPQNEKIDKLRADYQRTLHGENSYTEDVLIPARRLSDGSSFDERYFTSRRLQVHLPDGRVGVLAMGQNTTEQVKLRQVLEKKVEARTSDFEMFFNNSLDLLCIAGLDGYAKSFLKC